MAEKKEGFFTLISKPFVWVVQSIVSVGSWVISPIVKAFQGKDNASANLPTNYSQSGEKGRPAPAVSDNSQSKHGGDMLATAATSPAPQRKPEGYEAQNPAMTEAQNRGQKMKAIGKKLENQGSATNAFEKQAIALKEQQESNPVGMVVRAGSSFFSGMFGSSVNAVTSEVKPNKLEGANKEQGGSSIQQGKTQKATQSTRFANNPEQLRRNVKKIGEIEAEAGELKQGGKENFSNSRKIKDQVKAGDYLPDFLDFTKWGRSSKNPKVEAPRNTPAVEGKGTQAKSSRWGWGK